MKKKILLYHLTAFFIGTVAIAAYFFWKASLLHGVAGLTVVPLLVIAVVYDIGFGILCAFSCVAWILIKR